MILEFTRVGQFLKCTAVHAATGLEVSASGPVREPEGLKRVTLAKLRRALASR